MQDEQGRFELRPELYGDEHMSLATWPTSALNDEAAWSDEVIELAQNDCDARRQAQAYRVCFVSEDEVKSFHLLKLEPEEQDLVESSDPAGQIAQQMRHSEAMMRTLVGSVQTMMQGLQTQLRDAMKLNRELMKDRERVIEMEAELLRKQAEGETEQLEAVSRIEREDRLLQALHPIVEKALTKMTEGGES